MQNDMRDRLIKLLKTPNKSAILRKANPQFVAEETDEESIVADYLCTTLQGWRYCLFSAG